MPKYNHKINELVQAAGGLKDGKCATVVMDEPVTAYFRSAIRNALTRQGIGDNIVVSVGGEIVTLYRKSKSYTQKLEDMVRKMMLHVDNEAVYDEAMKLLEVQ